MFIRNQWRAGLKEFAKDMKDAIESIVFAAEKTPKGRKGYIDDAFFHVKLLAKCEPGQELDEKGLTPLQEDAMRIVDGTWEAHQEELHKIQFIEELKTVAVAAVASLANTPNRRYYKQSDIAAINQYLNEVPADHHSATIHEIGTLAREHYAVENENWLEGVLKELPELVKGQGNGLNL